MADTDNFFGSEGIWLFAILALMWGGNGLFGGGADKNYRTATAEDVQNASNFQALERQLNEGVAATRQGVYDVTGAIKDASYNNLGEIRDIQSAVSAGNAANAQCCCEILRGIDSVNYNGAINTASINANTTAGIQKVLDTICANRTADLQARVNQLELQSSLCGIVRYPTSMTYSAGFPFACGCSNGNY